MADVRLLSTLFSSGSSELRDGLDAVYDSVWNCVKDGPMECSETQESGEPGGTGSWPGSFSVDQSRACIRSVRLKLRRPARVQMISELSLPSHKTRLSLVKTDSMAFWLDGGLKSLVLPAAKIFAREQYVSGRSEASTSQAASSAKT